MITHLHRPLPADSPAARGIEVLGRAHQDLVWSRQRELNRLRSLLAGYYPAALAAFPDLASRRAHGGSAPTTRESGKKRLVVARYIRNQRLYDAARGWAFTALSTSPGARA